MDGGAIVRARIALGSVAHRPWRLGAAEERLAGMEATDREGLRGALEASFAEARPLAHNAYKIPLARNAALRVIETAARMPS
jgi:xanthine dehydrogenase YagS FAD-binding subunit